MKADTTGRAAADALDAEGAQALAGTRAAVGGPRAPLSPDEPATVVEVIERAMRVHPRPELLNYKREGRWRSIFDRNTTEAIAEGREELAKIEDPREKLRRIARHHLERLGADRDLAVVFQVELRGTTKFMEEFSAAGLAEYLGLIREVFEQGQEAGVFRRELNAKLVAKVLFGALDEMATNWILSKRRYRLAPMADQVLDIFLNGVRARK